MWSEHWLTWQEIVCGLIIVAPVALAAVLLVKVPKEPLRAYDLWAPCWSGVHPLWLFLYRGSVFLFMTLWFLRFVLSSGGSELLFYTQWTFALVTVYFAIATFISARGCWIDSKKEFKRTEETNEFLHSDLEINGTKIDTAVVLGARDMKAEFWGCVMQIVYQTSAGAVVLTDLTFWGLLVPFFYYDSFTLETVIDGMHSLNFLFLLIDTFLNRMSFPWYGIVYFAFWSCAYIIFQWTLHACGVVSWWPYPFLKLDTPWAPLWYLALAFVHVPCYIIYWIIVKAKDKYFPRFFPHAYAKLS
ncbi:transmembrane protein [Rhynchospora pubera]|uniref:Transmembrane protein n=1 Tax=Rhynchospora pubera TaxID=906938 RepID=A0AAV8CLB5_9POAL|nr:transmembrane protein [Rhynchospora pubera]KAJ4763079.1 transmembrane protein [Rhynchospora pubera]KAJ4791750.1 transmembrane protein [Rhynchospora pubera]